MLRPRIIPCLLIHNNGLVKTVNFEDPKYVGDPLNAVKIFNEKEADELIVLDIDATVEDREPDFELIKNLASECRMPLCYGGGVKTPEQAKKIVNIGVEKVALSSAIVENPQLVKRLAEAIGAQSVVAVLDVKKTGFFTKSYEVFIHNGKKSTGLDPSKFSQKLEEFGVGEIVINSIDKDGVMDGYDFELLQEVRSSVEVPMSALGGAGSLDDIEELIEEFGIIGAGAGSLFVFKGKYKAVLINYPKPKQKLELIDQSVGLENYQL